MKQIMIEIDENEYLTIKNYLNNMTLYPITIHLYEAVRNGKPLETVTEFADRCKECGARYGKLLKQGKMTLIETATQENLLQTVFNFGAENERLHDAFDKIVAEIETDTEKWWEDDECFAKLSDVLAIIDKRRLDTP